MKLKDKVVCQSNVVMDIWDPNCYLTTYAQLEVDMEGEIVEFLGQDEIAVRFYDVDVIVETDDFAESIFVLKRDLSPLNVVKIGDNVVKH
jgi:hypothetical protein